MNEKNPYNICTWDDQADCANCANQEKLACKRDPKIATAFAVISVPTMVVTIIGMIIIGFLAGAWWILIAFILWLVVIFGFIEIRALCTHCPYYAEESKALHCLGNNGAPKPWRYRPGPMNNIEKFIFLAPTILVVFILFPVGTFGYGIWFLVTHYAVYGLISLLGFIGVFLACLLSVGTFLYILKVFFCSKCVNFSCPFNTVHKAVVDEYLKKNPVMKEAWEKSGYKLGE